MNSFVCFVHISHCFASFFTGLTTFSSFALRSVNLTWMCTENIQVGKNIIRFSNKRKLCNSYLESYHISLPHYFLLGNQKHVQLLQLNVPAFVQILNLCRWKLVQFHFWNYSSVSTFDLVKHYISINENVELQETDKHFVLLSIIIQLTP